MNASLTSKTGLSLLVITLGLLALTGGQTSAQDLDTNYGFCCASYGEECIDSDAMTCAMGGYLFVPYADGADDTCNMYCGNSSNICGDGYPDDGECGPEGTCLEDCGEYKECYEYLEESECYSAAGCDWYYDDYGFFGGDFCEVDLYFCGDSYCDTNYGEDTSTCRRDCAQRCGNGVVEGDEECEPSEDDLDCTASCTYDACGDGVVGRYEYCDPDTGTTDDPTLAVIGNEFCNEYCEYSWCGDGWTDEWVDTVTYEYFFEECDDGNNTDGDGCANDCTSEYCGNEIIDYYPDGTQEECDDGNEIDGDGCSSWCTEEYCGNGEIDIGEDCDDFFYDENGWPVYDLYPYLFGETESCNNDCTQAICGDGYVNETAGEQCDRGDENSDEPDAVCRTDCTYGSCGDGILDEEYGEQCDEGLLNDDLGYCTTDCHVNACGNGHVEDGWEECDPYVGSDEDGTTDDPSVAFDMSEECTQECLWSYCGDGIVNEYAEEECDPDTGALESWYYADGNSADCTYYCTLTYCGDGITNEEAGEDCDPGYTCENGDDCTYSGVCSDGSACDVRDTDECTTFCTYNTTELLCCFDYDFENEYFLYMGEEGYSQDECEEAWGRTETYEAPIVEQADVDYWCGYTGACCFIDDEGYAVAEASSWEDCYWYEGEYVPAIEADTDADGSVTREEAWAACSYEPEYVCLEEGGGTERRNDGGEAEDDDSYVLDGVYITKDPNDGNCRAVYLYGTCEQVSFAEAVLSNADFFTAMTYCEEIEE